MKRALLIGGFSLLCAFGTFFLVKQSAERENARRTAEAFSPETQKRNLAKIAEIMAHPIDRSAEIAAAKKRLADLEANYRLPMSATPAEERRYFVDYALKILAPLITTRQPRAPDVTVVDGVVTVTFPVRPRHPREGGPDFAARIKFDKKNGRLIEPPLLGG